MVLRQIHLEVDVAAKMGEQELVLLVQRYSGAKTRKSNVSHGMMRHLLLRLLRVMPTKTMTPWTTSTIKRCQRSST